MDASVIFKYFPDLTDDQCHQIEELGPLYEDWNAKINVVSRKDIDNLYVNHVLHSLTIAKFFGDLPQGITILDMGTGGGFPGIPLAILYPQCHFHLIDRIAKKIKVANAIAESIGLKNVTFQHGDIGECRTRFNYVVSRAVMPLNQLVPLIRKNIEKMRPNSMQRWHNGLICLKGGDLAPEMAGINLPIFEELVYNYIPETHFQEKEIVYVSI